MIAPSSFRRLRVATDAVRRPGLRRTAVGTALVDISATGLAAFLSLLIAATLGATGRGEYAAVMAWFGVCLVVGELGQSAATCYYAAREPDRAADYVATARAMLVATGIVTLLVGWFVAPVLSHGQAELTWGYRIIFGTSVVMYVVTSYLAGIQTRSIPRWNVVRVSQSVFFTAGVLTLLIAGAASLLTVLAVFAGAVGAYAVFAIRMAGRVGLLGGRATPALVPPLTRYGISQVAALAPLAVNSRLDQIVLSQTVPAADLGRYAVAVGLTTIAVPFVGAIGSVAFPRLASRRAIPGGTARFQRIALVGSAAVAVIVLLPLAIVGPTVLSWLLGPDFAGSATIIWALAPGGVFLACGFVASDLLRGRNRPGSVARAYIVGAVLTVGLLFALLPTLGVVAAAVSSSLGYAVSFAMMVATLRRLPDDESR